MGARSPMKEIRAKNGSRKRKKSEEEEILDHQKVTFPSQAAAGSSSKRAFRVPTLYLVHISEGESFDCSNVYVNVCHELAWAGLRSQLAPLGIFIRFVPVLSE